MDAEKCAAYEVNEFLAGGILFLDGIALGSLLEVERTFLKDFMEIVEGYSLK